MLKDNLDKIRDRFDTETIFFAAKNKDDLTSWDFERMSMLSTMYLAARERIREFNENRAKRGLEEF